MTTLSYLMGIGVATLVLVLIIELLRRRALKERQAVWWFIAGMFALMLAIFPQMTSFLASALGVELPVNLVFFIGIAVLFLVSLQSSAEITRLERRVERLAEEIGIMRAESPHDTD